MKIKLNEELRKAVIELTDIKTGAREMMQEVGEHLRQIWEVIKDNYPEYNFKGSTISLSDNNKELFLYLPLEKGEKHE